MQSAPLPQSPARLAAGALGALLLLPRLLPLLRPLLLLLLQRPLLQTPLPLPLKQPHPRPRPPLPPPRPAAPWLKRRARAQRLQMARPWAQRAASGWG